MPGVLLPGSDLQILFREAGRIHHARGVVQGAVEADIRRILANINIPEPTVAAVVDRFRLYQTEVLQGLEPLDIIMERRQLAESQKLVDEHKTRADRLEFLLQAHLSSHNSTPFHRLSDLQQLIID